MTRQCEDWLTSYAEYTRDTLPPARFNKWVSVCLLSAALQRKVWAQNGLGAKFYPNFYVFLVGVPGTGKSTAIADIGGVVLAKAGIEKAADSGTAAWLRQGFEDAMFRSQAEAENPAEVHSSVVVFADELETFLKDERYDPDLFQMLTKAYNCPEELEHGTITGGGKKFPKAWLTILGGIQPDNLNKRIPPGTIGSGFTARVLFIYHAATYKEITWNTQEVVVDPALEEALVADLSHIHHHMKGQYAVSASFASKWNEFRKETFKEGRCPLSPNLETYWTRRPVHLTKLAIVCAASRSDKLLLEGRDFDRALDMLEEAEQFMPAVVSSLTKTREMQIADDYYRVLKEGKPRSLAWLHECYADEVSAWDVKNRIIRDLELQGKVEAFYEKGDVMYRLKRGKE